MLFDVIIDSYLSLAIVCVGHSLPHVHAQAAIISRLHHLHLDSLHIWLEWRKWYLMTIKLSRALYDLLNKILPLFSTKYVIANASVIVYNSLNEV